MAALRDWRLDREALTTVLLTHHDDHAGSAAARHVRSITLVDGATRGELPGALEGTAGVVVTAD